MVKVEVNYKKEYEDLERRSKWIMNVRYEWNMRIMRPYNNKG